MVNKMTRHKVRTVSAGRLPGFSKALYTTLLLATAVCLPASAGPLYAQGTAQIYSQQCASCHGDKGKGDGPAGQYLNPKPTDFATSLKGKADDWIAKAITGGGAAIGGAPVMPPFPNLTADQVKGLVDYLKQLGS